jgi:prophage regulatory protein
MQFIRTQQVLKMIGVGRTTLWRMVQEGSFPRPVRVTQRNAGYLLEAVEHWMRTRTQGLPWEPTTSEVNSPIPAAPVRRVRPRIALARDVAGARG